MYKPGKNSIHKRLKDKRDEWLQCVIMIFQFVDNTDFNLLKSFLSFLIKFLKPDQHVSTSELDFVSLLRIKQMGLQATGDSLTTAKKSPPHTEMKCHFEKNVHHWFCWKLSFSQLPVQWVMKHDDVIKWKHFLRNWPFVLGILWSSVNSSHKGQWCGALMFSLICAWINTWVNNREAGDLRHHRTHQDVTVLTSSKFWPYHFTAYTGYTSKFLCQWWSLCERRHALIEISGSLRCVQCFSLNLCKRFCNQWSMWYADPSLPGHNRICRCVWVYLYMFMYVCACIGIYAHIYM